MLRTLPDSYKSHWHQHLNKVVNAYNCTRHDTTGFSPFYLLFGRQPRLPIDLLFNIDIVSSTSSYTDYLRQWKAAMEEAYEIVKKRVERSASRNKERYDRATQPVQLNPGDRVLVRNLSERGGPG